MPCDIAVFDSLGSWEAKANELDAAFSFPNKRAERYTSSPIITKDGKYGMQVLPEALQYFNGVQLYAFDDVFQPAQPTPTYSPEAWTSQHFSPMQVSALQRFEFAFGQAGKPLGPQMTALKTWLEGMLVASVDPTPRTFDAPPCSYEAASAEAVAALQP